MSASLETLAREYWASSQALRRRNDVSRATAARFLTSQAQHPAHPLIERACRQTIADLGLSGIECLRPCDAEPVDWPEISRRIRFERAGGRCECEGECGIDHAEENDAFGFCLPGFVGHPDERCNAKHERPHHVTGSMVVLTTAHLDHTPENCDDNNLRAMCQRCHLAYDRETHRQTRRSRMALGDLFDGPRQV